MIFSNPEAIPGIVIIEPDIYRDERGFFQELWHCDKYSVQGLPSGFLQDNTSVSYKNVIRGLHYQINRPQGKLIFVTEGEIFDVAVDLRKGSPSFGKWFGINLSSSNSIQIYIPPGFAHGFQVLSESSRIIYKCTDTYSLSDERGIIWNDPALNIGWQTESPIVSTKDMTLPFLKDIPENELPEY